MSEARTRILARLRAAQRTSRLPAVADDWRYEPPARSAPESLERFQHELSILGVEHHLADSVEDVRARVESLVAGRRVLSWDRERLPYDLGRVLKDPVFGSAPRDLQAAAEVGLTGCEAAVAETGSLVLLSGPGRSRAVSLLPPWHVAVVRRPDLVFSMGEFFRAHAGGIAAAASCTFVTGPSRTADIELTLTLGVHGPAAVTVVIGP
ncbi:MAG TPA: LUD domain-containing protein [Vicinamibacteria bacterium]|nr:LUD domain-containing protein [Vicinamibacteria bacterium]